MQDELIYIIYKILRTKGYGVVGTNKFLSRLIGCDNLAEKLKSYIIEEFSESFFQPDEGLNDMLTSAKNNGVKFITILDKDYPDFLKKALVNNAPPVLSFIGNINLLPYDKVGFCGSRKASDKGLDIAKDCALQLAENNVVIVSGYASGVDMQTHYWGLKNNGCTIIILPEGINHFYIKRDLKDIWDWERALVISEFEPGSPWSVAHAMRRNNTIIALSDIMIIIEAGETGGSIDAGEKTLKMQKHLFTPIYDGVPQYAIGNSILIKKGALPIKKSAATLRVNLKPVFKLLK